MRPADDPPRASARSSAAGDAGREYWHRRWDGRRADGEWPRGSPIRLWAPVVVSALAQIPFALVRAARPGLFDVDVRTALLALVLAVIGPASLTAARAFPGPVVAVVSAAASADLLLPGGYVGPPYVALAFAILSAVVRGARLWAWISVSAGFVVTLVGGAMLRTDFRPFAIVGITLGILVVLWVGEGVRTRRERFAQYSRATAARKQTEAQAERVRIARELHDVLAHSLSQINVQAAVGLHLMPSHPEKAAEALASIKESSKSALDEVRAVLGVLREDVNPHANERASLVPEPDLSRLAKLVASVRSDTIDVSLHVDVEDEPSSPIQLAVYRIVQEALTNVVRHSGASAVDVEVVAESSVIRVTVSDNGRGGDGAERSEGRGLLGMRERAELYGGQLETRSSPGGFTVTASLPVDSRVQR